MICTGCGLEINDRAPTCFQCGTINKLVPQTGRFIPLGASTIQWQGERLLLPEALPLEARWCWICGQDGPDLEPTPKKLFYTPPIAYIGFVAGLLPFLILVLVLRKTATPRFPLCAPCRRRWTRAEVGYALFVLLGIFACPLAGGSIGYQIDPETAMWIGVVVGLLSYLVGIFAMRYVVCGRVQIWATRIEQGVITLRLPNPEAVRRALADEKGVA